VTSYGGVKRSDGSASGRRWERIGIIAGVMALVAMVGGCAAMFKPPPPSSLYQLQYSPQPAECQSSFPASIRVLPLEAPPPYDQESLVVLADGARVRFSSQYSWVAQPGKMIADWLLRDFSQTQLFSSVMTSGESFANSYDLGGHLFTFAWQRRQDRWQALLDAEITLVENRSGQSRQILLRKPYHLVSDPVAEHDPEAFARAMSKVMGELSAVLQQDLCALAGKLRGSSGGVAAKP
jgi:ABC-type uncharacterized transport system auxiliary subunit